MPESEPKPKLIELVAPGAGQGWKATLRNGKAVVIHEIPAPAAEAAAAVPRIQRLAEHRHPALSPVLAWGTDPNGIWVAVEPNEGTPLGQILSRGPLTPPAAAALGAGVLSGVAALHEAGIAMGGFGAAAIRVNGNGDVRLSGHAAAAVRGAPSQSDLRADVRSCGMAICAAFGVDPAGAPAPPGIPPGLVVTMRSMASGAMGPAADRAQGALREMASALLAPDRMTAAQSELALRAGGREMPSIMPFLPKETYPPAPAQPTAPQQTAAPQPWGAPQQTSALQPQPPAPVPPAPAPYVPPTPKPDETPTPRPSASYDAPMRPLETYPPNAPPPYVPPQRQEEERPRPGAGYEPPPRAPETFPTVPPPIPSPPPPAAPIPTWDDKPAGPPSSTWDVVETPKDAAPAPAPPKPLDTWDTLAAALTPVEPPAEAPPPPAPTPVPEPPKEEARATWTAITTPAWSPDKASEPVEAPAPPGQEPEPEPEPVPAYVAPTMAPTPPPPSMVTRAPAPAPPVHKPPAPRRPVYDQPTERPSWLMPAIAGVVILLLLLVGGGIYLAKRGGSNNPVATTSPGTSPRTSPGTSPGTSPKTSPKASPKASPSPAAPLAVPTYAPTSADPITRVQFCSPATPCPYPGNPAETNTSCNLTGTCHVEVGFYFSKAQKSPVAFAFKFFDRCANTTVDIAGPNPYSPPGYIVLIFEKNITIPSGAKSAALVAVSSTPATAATAPLLMGSDSCT